MLPMLAMAGANAGLSLLSGIGARNSAKKQGRLQMMEDARMDQLNQERLWHVNKKREELGRELLTIEEKTTVADNSWQTQTGDVDYEGFMAAGAKAGFNPVTWLNSGALSLFARNKVQNGGEVTTTRTGHNAADAFKLMAPDMLAGSPTQIAKVPDMMEVLGGAGQAGLSMFKDLYKMDQSQAFQTNMLDRQLSAIAQRQMGGGVMPGGSSYGPSISTGGAAGLGGALNIISQGSKDKDMVWPSMEQPSDQMWKNDETKTGNPFPPSWGWKNPPGFAQTSSWEDWGGEAVSLPYGVWKLYNTALYNTVGKTHPDIMRTAYDINGALRNMASSAFAPSGPNMTRYAGTPYSQGSASP